MCYSPISIKVKDESRISVPCGKCPECLQKKRSEWTFRLLTELNICNSAHFITLTYDDDNLPNFDIRTNTFIDRGGFNYEGNPDVAHYLEKKEAQLFIKRLRKENDKVSKEQLRYFFVGEYGDKTRRPHYHAIFFNLKKNVVDNIEKIWKYGFVHVGEVNQSSIHYVTKYMLKHQEEKNTFSLCSKRPFIGHSYLTPSIKRYHKKHNDMKVQFMDSTKIGMPRIYKSKIYSKISRQLIGDSIVHQLDMKEAKKASQFVNNDEYQNALKQERSANYRKVINQRKSKKV